jgi:hypothetical protein
MHKSKPKFRSGFEQTFYKSAGKQVEYEQVKLTYIQPASNHTYTPDFHIPGTNIFIELKGIWDSKDRQKHLLIKQQHPDKRIILVFQRPTMTITKTSKTTYQQWAAKHGIETMTQAQAIKLIESNRPSL